MTITSEPPVAPVPHAYASSRRSRSIVLGCALVLAAVLVAAAVLVFGGKSAHVRVPNVVGMQQTSAVTTLEAEQLRAKVVNLSHSPAVSPPIGMVMSESPVPEKSVPKHSVVQLNVFGASYVVPNVLGLSATAAEVELTTARFNYRVVASTGVCMRNTVESQRPAGGTMTNVWTAVQILVC